MRWKWEEVREDWRKELRTEGEEEEKVGPTRRMWRGIGRERERRSEMREGMGRGPGPEAARDFLREEARDGKGSFVDLGSRWDWWVRKESRPRIGAEVLGTAAVQRRRIRRRAAVGIFYFGGWFGLLTGESWKNCSILAR